MSTKPTLLEQLKEIIQRMGKRKNRKKYTPRRIAQTNVRKKSRTPHTMTLTVSQLPSVRDTTFLTLCTNIKRLIETPDHWCHDALARDANGERMSLNDKNKVAVKYSLVGAVVAAARIMQLRPEQVDSVRRALNTIAWYSCNCCLASVDGHPTHGHTRALSFCEFCINFFKRNVPFGIANQAMCTEPRAWRHERHTNNSLLTRPPYPLLPRNPVTSLVDNKTPLLEPTNATHSPPVVSTIPTDPAIVDYQRHMGFD